MLSFFNWILLVFQREQVSHRRREKRDLYYTVHTGKGTREKGKKKVGIKSWSGYRLNSRWRLEIASKGALGLGGWQHLQKKSKMSHWASRLLDMHFAYGKVDIVIFLDDAPKVIIGVALLIQSIGLLIEADAADEGFCLFCALFKDRGLRLKNGVEIDAVAAQLLAVVQVYDLRLLAGRSSCPTFSLSCSFSFSCSF
ncbi:hypothetical protein BC940DRAFT_170648 [Gongronella butleri]|nr:hypothetical protein BC940DRAFT_170648 [Gongronella butleri]